MATPLPRWSQGEHFFREMPVTKVIILLWVISFLSSIVAPGLQALLYFIPFQLPNTLTGLLTHPLVFHGAQDIINLAFSSLMLYWFGGSLERSWGARSYLAFLLLANSAAVGIWESGLYLFTGSGMPFGTPWWMITSVVVAWAWLNPDETILLYFVLPVKAKWIGWGSIVVHYFFAMAMVPALGFLLPVLGLFSLGGIAVAFLYTRYQRLWGWIPRQPKSPNKPASRVLYHPRSHPVTALLRPFQEWQRRRRIAYLQRTFKLDDEDQERRK